MTTDSKHWLDRGHWSPGSDITTENQHYARWYQVRTFALMEAVGNLATLELEDRDPNSPWSHEEVRDAVAEIKRQVDDWMNKGFPWREDGSWTR